jgi:hypothetical protein
MTSALGMLLARSLPVLLLGLWGDRSGHQIGMSCGRFSILYEVLNSWAGGKRHCIEGGGWCAVLFDVDVEKTVSLFQLQVRYGSRRGILVDEILTRPRHECTCCGVRRTFAPALSNEGRGASLENRSLRSSLLGYFIPLLHCQGLYWKIIP